jgi:arylsulfatase A-like enzyme
MPRYALVIAIDGLRASALGAYGNAWHPTPALDALASRSQVFDWAFLNSPQLEDFYRTAWGESNQSLLATLKQRRWQSKLLTDDPAVAALAQQAGFDEVERLAVACESAVTNVEETQLAQFFASAVEELEAWSNAANDHPRLLWFHTHGLRGQWDAPLELLEQLLDEDDPPAPTFVTPPTSVATIDHDELLLYRAAYAAQIMVLDECLAALLTALKNSPAAENTAVVFVGARGYALGEHGHVGGDVHALYGELLHIPLLVHTPGDEAPPPRSAELMQPADLQSLLFNWLKPSTVAESTKPPRQFVTASNESGERMIRTPAWMLRQLPPPISEPDEQPPTPTVELYAKPDDRWEANEIADRCPEVAERLLAVLDAATTANQPTMEIPPLDGDLVRSAR